jgi:hypothetical protein
MERRVLWKPKYFNWSDRHRIVWVSVAAFDASWRKDVGYYVAPGAINGDGTAWRYARFGRWLQAGNPRRRVNMPVVGYNSTLRCVGFEDGRHRTAWLRDHGAMALPVLVYIDDADIIATELGTAERTCYLSSPLRDAA